MHETNLQDGAVLQTELLRNDRLLRSLAAELTGRGADAEDLVQDTWVLALRWAPGLDGPRLSAWLATALRRAAGRTRTRDRLRRERERDAVEAAVGPEEIARVEERIDAQILLLESVRRLPEKERECVLLRYESELSPPAIAQRLEAPLNTVKARLRRGLERLREDVERRSSGGLHGWSAALGGVTWDGLRSSSAAGTGSGVKWLAAALSIAVGAVGAFELASRGGAPPEDVSVRTSREPRPGIELAISSAGVWDGVRSSAQLQGAERPVAQAVTGADEARQPLVVLRVFLDGLQDDERAHLEMRVRPDGDPFPGDELVEADQHFGETVGYDLTRLFEVGAGAAAFRSASIVVRATHPRASEVIEVVDLPGSIAPGSRYDVTVTMEPTRRVFGLLVGTEGQPVANALVAAYPFDPGGVPILRAAGYTRSRADGTFELSASLEGDLALVALSMRERPATSIVHSLATASVEGAPATDAGTIQFDEGYSIEGRIVARGAATVAPTSLGAIIRADTEATHPLQFYEVPGYYGEGAGALVWRDGRFETLGVMAEVHERGRFTLEGLAPAEYELHVHGFAHSHPRVTKPVKTRVTAPRSGVLIEVPYVLVDLAFEVLGARNAKRPSGGVLHLEREGHATETTEIYGGEVTAGQHRTFTFDPGERVVFRAEMPGRLPAEAVIDLPSGGGSISRVLTLAPDPSAAALVLRPEGIELGDGATLKVHVYPEGTSDEALRWAGLRHDGRVRSVRVEDGVVRLDGLPTGALEIVAYVGEHTAQRATLYQDARASVALSAGEVRELPLVFEPGGRLRVSATDESGEHVRVQADLLDAFGKVLPVTFVAYAPGGGGSSMHTHLGPEGPNVVVPNLPAGEYTLRLFLPGGRTLDRTVSVEPHEVCDVRLSIERS